MPYKRADEGREHKRVKISPFGLEILCERIEGYALGRDDQPGTVGLQANQLSVDRLFKCKHE